MHTMNRKDCAEWLQKCVEHSEKMDRTTVIFYNSEVEEIIRQLLSEDKNTQLHNIENCCKTTSTHYLIFQLYSFPSQCHQMKYI